MELYELTALELGEKLRSGEVTQQQAVEAALGRIAAVQPGNNAFITVDGSALSRAAELSACPAGGGAHGLQGQHLHQGGAAPPAPPRSWGTSPPATTPPWWSG